MTNQHQKRFRFIWLLALVSTMAVAGIVWLAVRREARSALQVYGSVPDFTLTERSGRTVTRADLDGRLWIADFVFTRCPGPCPAMSAQMAYLQNSLKTVDRLRLVSFTVDPDYDTPAVLSEYANRFEADKTRWLFLTGKKEAIYALASRGLHVPVGENPESEQMPEQGPIFHSLRFVLMDEQSRIRGYYDSNSNNELSRLERDVQTLLRERKS